MYDTNSFGNKDSGEQAENQARADGGRSMATIAERERSVCDDEGEAALEADGTTGCPECGGRVRTNVHETVCDDCGLVVSEEAIDRGREWRSFDDDREDRRRVGAPNTVARHDRGIGTEIGHKRDGRGRELDGAKRTQLARLRREHRRAKVGSKAQRNRIMGFSEIRRMIGALGLETSLRDQACQLFRTAQDEGLLRGRSIEGIASACVYAVCRLNEYPRTFEELETLSKVGVGRIENGYSVLNRELGLPVPPADPMRYLPKVASAVGLDAETEARAREVIEAADRELLEGVHPGGVAAGALYVAGRQLGGWVTQGELADAAGVSGATVRARYRDFE